ncbi:MAG TPA: GyrI-like domain-containing protein [Vicinamibacterales bacterium]|nr:GyrI-like domain-containing protein [Vicinamibacterales bacterium]
MDYEIKTLPAMRLATVPHTGPYHEIGPALIGAWMKMRDALGGGGALRRRQAPACEIYWNDPSRVKPAELKTDICVPTE